MNMNMNIFLNMNININANVNMNTDTKLVCLHLLTCTGDRSNYVGCPAPSILFRIYYSQFPIPQFLVHANCPMDIYLLNVNLCF